MIWRCPTKAGDGKLLVRASATILCVRKGTSLRKETIEEFTHIVLADVDMTGELSAHRILAHRNTSEVVFV